MSGSDFLIELDDIGDSFTTRDVRVISGAYVSTADQFIQALYTTVTNMVFGGVQETVNSLISSVAKDTGAMRSAITSQFFTQIVDFRAKKNFSLFFDRGQLDDPDYLKYHDIEWDLNIHYNRLGYKNPTTPNTRPFSENEFMLELFDKLLQELTKQWIEKGFSFSIKARGPNI